MREESYKRIIILLIIIILIRTWFDIYIIIKDNKQSYEQNCFIVEETGVCVPFRNDQQKMNY